MQHLKLLISAIHAPTMLIIGKKDTLARRWMTRPIPRFKLSAADLNIATAEGSYLKLCGWNTVFAFFWLCYIKTRPIHSTAYLLHGKQVEGFHNCRLTMKIWLAGPNLNCISSIWAGPIYAISWVANAEWIVQNIDITALIIWGFPPYSDLKITNGYGYQGRHSILGWQSKAKTKRWRKKDIELSNEEASDLIQNLQSFARDAVRTA